MNQFINGAVQKYIKYSKRIVLFGIAQWALLAAVSLIVVLLSNYLGISVDEWVSRVVNNVVTCSSTLAIAICSGYYAHSAYDNALKQRVEETIVGDVFVDEDETSVSNG